MKVITNKEDPTIKFGVKEIQENGYVVFNIGNEISQCFIDIETINKYWDLVTQ